MCTVLRLLIAVLLALGAARPAAVHGACNIIPPAERAYPSTLGSVTDPVTTVGNDVEIRLADCDGSAGFNATPASNQIAIAFLPAGGGQPPPVIVASGSIVLADCTGPVCKRLHFTMPSTPNLAGPAEVTVTVAATLVASIGPLFQAHEVGSTCDKQPETVFQQFTVLPPPNKFGDLVSGAATQALATLDGSGSLVIPLDYRQVLPLGPGAPVARLLSGATTLDAFPGTPGFQPMDVPTSYVRSFTIDGRPLPPLLRATDAGNKVFGATDGAVAIIRVARTGDQGVKFDLSSLRTNGGYGPIVFPNSQYTVATSAAIPLENLHSTATGVAFARDEQVEGNLNAASGDTDTNDKVIQLVEVGTFTSTNTGMAASATHNPIVGGAALDVGPTFAAFLESEVAQNNTDLNGDGDNLDDILRVFAVTGTQLTPSATLVGDPFPGVNRKPVAIDGPLVYYREPQPGIDGGPGIGGLGAIAVSPDGRYLYEVSAGTIAGLLIAHHLDGETGGEQRDTSAVFLQNLLDGATGVAVSPDSRFLFVAEKSLNSLESMELRYEPIGQLSVIRFFNGGGSRLSQGGGGVDGLTGVTWVAVAPDGKHAYAVADGDDAVTTFSIDPTHGVMTFVQAIKNGVGITNMADPIRLAVSADGKNVYVAARGSSALQVFTRNTTTGVLTSSQTLLDGGTGGTALGGITDVAVSPDGLNVYAISDTDSGLTIFSRNTTTGALTFVQALTNGVGGLTDLNGGKAVIVSPDGASVYATTAFGHLLVFTRTMPGGGLTLDQSTGVNFGVPLPTVNLAISPDSEHVYQVFNEGGAGISYARRGALRAFDTTTMSLRPGLTGSPGASLAAAAGGRAVFTTAAGSGNAQLYDAATDTVTQIGSGVHAAKVALSANLIAMIVPESSLGVDGNKDGDDFDNVLIVASPSDPAAPPKVVPIEAEDIGVTDLCLGGAKDGAPCTTAGDCPEGTCRGLVVVATNEYAYKDSGEDPHPPDADFNHNGSVGITIVLFVYDAGTGKLTNVGWQAFDFIVGGHLVAFRTDENELGVDLNGNSITSNIVMMIYDLATGSLINPVAAAVRCELPGCEPGLPYKIKGNSVVFLVPESDQGPNGTGLDLDGNGQTDNIVVLVYDTGSATTQVLTSVDAAGTLPAASIPLGGTPPLLPTTFTDGQIVYKQVKESDLGKDLNEDGDMNDVVTLVDGDSDGDGVFDREDVCTETPNADQLDSDEDGLPDACDPNPYCAVIAPPAPMVPPSTVEPCQKTLGKSMQKLVATQEKATRKCLEKVAKGQLVGEPTFLCRGGVANGVPVLPGDPGTALKIQKAVSKLAKVLPAKCPDATLAQLQACATDAASLAQCAAVQATRTVVLVSGLDYGEVGPIVDPTALACQKAIGKTSGKYLTTVVKVMGSCLDKLNEGKLTGSGDTLCLGAGTSSGFTLPSDPKTAEKIQKAGDNTQAALAKVCPGTTAAALHACGTDATSLTDCIRCAHGRQALETIRTAYGP